MLVLLYAVHWRQIPPWRSYGPWERCTHRLVSASIPVPTRSHHYRHRSSLRMFCNADVLPWIINAGDIELCRRRFCSEGGYLCPLNPPLPHFLTEFKHFFSKKKSCQVTIQLNGCEEKQNWSHWPTAGSGSPYRLPTNCFSSFVSLSVTPANTVHIAQCTWMFYARNGIPRRLLQKIR